MSTDAEAPMPRPPLIVALALMAATAGAAEPAAIRYAVKFPDPRTHTIEVEATIPTAGAAAVELMMPVWTPGSYLVREYARNVEDLSAKGPDGKILATAKVRKNRWRVEAGGAASAVVRYKVYCREMSVRTNWVDASFALINGAPTFLTLADGQVRPHEIILSPPKGWLRSITPLPEAPSGKPHHYVAADYDTLVDSPILVGNPAVYEFEVDGKRHYLVNEGESGVWDGSKSARDVEAIVREHRKFWGQLPYDKYVFFNLLVEAGGGLEHKSSTVLMGSRWATRTRKTYLGWLDLVGHEFFHAWNVKRLRPVELGPFDYENEVYTKSLWIAEGLTTYYGPLLVKRAGLADREEFLGGDPESGPAAERSGGPIEQLQTTPGRLVQSLESASFDAWIKYYRPDENSANTAISYYTKGSVVGMLMDAKIRKATNGAKSLDDAMRLAYTRYSGAKGYTPEEFRATVQEVAGVDMKPFFTKALESTEELDYTEAYDWYGLRNKPAKDEKGKPKPEKAWLGLTTKADEGRLMVTAVRRGTPGHDAGFNVGDEIIALGENRVRPSQWSDRMEQHKPNEVASVLISRRDRLIRLEATFAAEPPKLWTPEPRPDATEEQKAHLKAWLGE